MAELDTNVNPEATEPNPEPDATSAEIERLKAELARNKAALDKATKEAGDFRKQLREKQTAEEAAAQESAALQKAMQEELEQLRKEKAVSSISTKLASIVGDAGPAEKIAAYLYGAENPAEAISAIQKAWTAKENALRLEYGKIPAPGVGSGSGPIVTKEQLDSMKFSERSKFAAEHPDEYNKLMGR